MAPVSILPPARSTPAIVLGLTGAILVFACWGIHSSPGAVKAREREERIAAARADGGASAEPLLLVEAFRVRRTPAIDVVELSGSLDAVRSTWVAAEIAGSIEEVPAIEHTPISKGDVLVRLDASLPRAELIRAEAAHALARSELARQQRLGKQSVASEAELDRAISEERTTFAALLEAQTRLSHTEIRAPFDGVVNTLDLDPGAYVQPGTRIAEVLDVASVELTVQVSDRQLAAMKPGGEVSVRVDALGNQLLDGRLARVGRAPDAESRRYPVVVLLPNPEGRLVPGMLAHVELEVGGTPSLRAPARAFVREFELDYIYALEPGDAPGEIYARRVRVKARPVPFRPDWVEILSGISDDTRVVVGGLGKLRDGDRVRVDEPRAMP
jgi:membrane fusion protein (multidrug efflux system)